MIVSRYHLKDVADQLLLANLSKLVGHSNEITADILAHLAEIDRRKLYLAQSCASLFVYCTTRLGLSEGAAYKRIYAARAAQKFPVIFDLIRKGELHLSAVALLAAHLNDNNHAELLRRAAHKSKREVEQLVASYFPAPKAPEFIRKVVSKAAKNAAPISNTMPLAPVTPTSATISVATPAWAMTPITAATKAIIGSIKPASSVVPLAAEQYRLQVTLSQSGRDALQRAKDLLGPGHDLAAICERALTELVEKLERRKFAKTKRTRVEPATKTKAVATTSDTKSEDKSEAKSTAKSANKPNEASDKQSADQSASKAKRTIPAAIRRVVAVRDAYQCTFVAPDGRRCQERTKLEYHHDEPFARGGLTTADNLRLLCRAHNGYHAVRDFGAVLIEKAIAKRREPAVERSPGVAAKQRELLISASSNDLQLNPYNHV